MATLYIDRKDSELRADGRALVVHVGGARQGSVPLGLVDRVVVHAHLTLDTTLLGTLAAEGIPLVIVNSRRPERTVFLCGSASKDASRRLGQFRVLGDPDRRVRLATRLVRAKLQSQRAMLADALGRRPDRRRALFAAGRQIEARLAQLDELAEGAIPALQRIRGLEGAAAAAHFGALVHLFPASVGFRSRNRRPPRDPVNACLSLGYTILHSEGVAACHAAGLDPALGFFHEPAFGRASLAADCIEPLRPRVDAFVWELFRERSLSDNHFVYEAGACRLSKEGRSRFYPAWEEAARPWRRWLRMQLMRLAHEFAEGAAPALVHDEG